MMDQNLRLRLTGRLTLFICGLNVNGLTRVKFAFQVHTAPLTDSECRREKQKDTSCKHSMLWMGF